MMLLLALARQQFTPTLVDNSGLYELRHPMYPIASMSGTGWTLNSGGENLSDSDKSLQGLMTYTNYLNYDNATYVPMVDPLGPMLFHPPHC